MPIEPIIRSQQFNDETYRLDYEIKRTEVLSSIDALIADAVAKERGACAKIAVAFDETHPDTNYGLFIANRINERSAK